LQLPTRLKKIFHGDIQRIEGKGKMRDKRFVAEHRGGPLKKEQHHQLIAWACGCAKHVLHLLGEPIDERLKNALLVAHAWKQGKASVGDAMKASVAAHAAAREFSHPTSISVARSVGHAVATAHMADHSLGAAWYALKAVKNAGNSTDAERIWQDKQLPSEIKDLILTARKTRKI
jgi:hypothetical protein